MCDVTYHSKDKKPRTLTRISGSVSVQGPRNNIGELSPPNLLLLIAFAYQIKVLIQWLYQSNIIVDL